MSSSGLEEAFPRSSFVTCCIVRGAFVGFFFFSAGTFEWRVFLCFLLISFALNLVMDGMEKRGSKSLGGHAWAFLVGLSVVIASGFGGIIYGNVYRELGGGEPVPVEFGLDGPAVGVAGGDEAGLLRGKLVFVGSTDVYVDRGDDIVAVPKHRILWTAFPESVREGASSGGAAVPRSGVGAAVEDSVGGRAGEESQAAEQDGPAERENEAATRD